ncbi:hypothetical protein CANINC_003931 [Pichia inconspicua]|uniref:LicD/FKTN/FKRP nucleotidyltransferase domain-containing protein n=1 Tax=Pichia inconspicua TaxID=52247 RepID=A0A4V4NFB8_9ASCO|nr:hypothetical protein CANINC_003931 [[Candida] inconspicua]
MSENRSAYIRQTSHRLLNDIQMRDYDFSSTLPNLELDNLIDSDDDDYFTQHEESVYKDLFRKLQLWFEKCFRIYLYPYWKQILFAVCIIVTIHTFISTSTYTNSYTRSNRIQPTPLDKIIIPHLNNLYPDENIDQSSSLFDFRLSSALLLLYIKNHITHNNMRLEEGFSIPFSWNDWVDLDTRLEFNEEFLVEWLSVHSNEFQNDIKNLGKLDCHDFSLLFGIGPNNDFKRQCEDLKTPITGFPYMFSPNGPTTAKMKEPGRILYGAAYLKLRMLPPSKIYMMNVLGSDGDGSLMVNVHEDIKSDKILRSPSVLKSFIDSYCNENNLELGTFNKNGWSIGGLRKSFTETLDRTSFGKIIYPEEYREIDMDETYVVIRNPKKDNKMRMDQWSFDDFQWNEAEFLDKLSSKSALSDNNYDSKLYEHIDQLEQYRINTGKHPKYLHEALLYGTTIGSHYDWRFFTTSAITDDYRQSIIHRLARTWLKFCFENGIKTFIAYGSMLGWIMNGLTLPWDGDIDAVVTMESFNLLARNFNQTLLIDYSEVDGFQSAMSGYLIDINPAYYSRVKGDGANVIDGRLIDISTGMYLDITALAWTENYLAEVQMTESLKKLIDKDYEMNKHFALEGEIYDVTVQEQLRLLQSNKDLVHCKNDNVYRIDELTKMIPSYFEGIRAYFPHSFEDIIWRLYPKALSQITWLNHVYDVVYHLWVDNFDCPDYTDELGYVLGHAKFGTCNSSVVLQEYRLTKDYTTRHQKLMLQKDFSHLELSKESESPPFRVDEFFIIYSALLGLTSAELETFYTHNLD